MPHGANEYFIIGQNDHIFVTWPWPRPMVNYWPLLEPGAHVALKWWILYNPDHLFDERSPAQRLAVHTAEGSILSILSDLDLTRDPKIEIFRAHQKCLVASFRLPPRPSRCGHWFSSYRLGAFNAPPPPSPQQDMVGGEILHPLPD